MSPELAGERLGQGDGAPSGRRLRGILDHLAGGESKPLPPYMDDAGIESEVVAPEREELALAETGEAGGEDQRPVPIDDSVGQGDQLLHGGAST